MTIFTHSPCDAAIVRVAPFASPCIRAAEPWILAATILASSMVFIDGTVVNVALPALQSELNATIFDAQWVVESYALLLATLLLAGGAAGDRFGRRRVFAAGVVLFAAASAWCGSVNDIGSLIAARAAQGAGGALLVPGSLAIISACFDESRRGRAIGTWSAATAVTAALGPVLGGWLIDHSSWRAAFLINVPLAVAVLAITYWRVPESRNEAARGALDWQGAVLSTLGLGGIVYGLIESSYRGWTSPAVLIALGVGAAASAGFLAVEARRSAPMLPLALFRSRTFLGTNLLTLLLYAALGGGLFFFPLNLIQVQGYSATEAGAALLPFVLLVSVLSRWTGGLADRYGARAPLIAGPALAAAGFALFALPSVGGSYWTSFFPAVVILGLGMAVTVAPLTTAVMNSVASSLAGTASGINNAASRVAALLALALLGVILAQVFNRSLDERLAQAQLDPAVLQHVANHRAKFAALEMPATVDAGSRAVVRQAVEQSFVTGFRWVMVVSALLALAAAASAWLLIDGAPGQRKISTNAVKT